MNRLKYIAHKWYVAFVTLKHVIQFLYRATERIAGFKVTIITEKDLEHEAIQEEDEHEEVADKDLN